MKDLNAIDIVIKQFQAVLDQSDEAIAGVYKAHRDGTNSNWYEARKAYDLLAQFRFDVVNVRKQLEKLSKLFDETPTS